MRSPLVARLAVVVLAVAGSLAAGSLAACSGGGSRGPTSPAGDPSGAGDGGADAASPADAGPAEKPFAGSSSEATQLVSAAIDKHRAEMASCVDSYRKRKKLAHARVEVQVGIDQEGNLLGATLGKGKQDPELSACVQSALSTAVFPRSHSGVISITKVYEEILQ